MRASQRPREPALRGSGWGRLRTREPCHRTHTLSSANPVASWFNTMASWGLVLAGLSLLLSLASQTRANYTLEARAHRYENDDHLLANGHCCDQSGTSNCIPSWCGFCECDNRFVFCLRNADHPQDGDEDDCPLGRFA